MNMGYLKKIFFALMCAALLGSGSAASQTAPVKSTLDVIKERGVLLAGVRFDYPPNGFVNSKGEVVGYGPDLAREFAKHLGVDVKFVQATSQTRIPLLLNGQIDAEFGITTPSKVRDEVVDFSLVYNIEQTVVLVRKGESRDPKDYMGSGRPIGVLQGSIFGDLWKQQDPTAELKLYQEYPQLSVAVLQKKVDASLMNYATAVEFAKNHGGDLVIGEPFFQDVHSIMVRENDSNWLDWVNWGLQRLWKNGRLQEIYEHYYKFPPTMDIWQNKMLQPGISSVAEKDDYWLD
jgi:polar amino acid transport system substrate-binding protein